MRGKRIKWIRKVVISKHPKVTEMIKERIGEEKANKMTYGQVIELCKKLWKEHTPGIKEWGIYEEAREK